MDRIKKAEFMAKLKGAGAPDFGFIDDRKEFLDFCVDHDYLSYHGIGISGDYHVYRILKDFCYSAKGHRHVSVTMAYTLGHGGGMLVDLDHRMIGYKLQETK